MPVCTKLAQIDIRLTQPHTKQELIFTAIINSFDMEVVQIWVWLQKVYSHVYGQKQTNKKRGKKQRKILFYHRCASLTFVQNHFYSL